MLEIDELLDGVHSVDEFIELGDEFSRANIRTDTIEFANDVKVEQYI